MPVKEDKTESGGAKGGLHPEDTLDIVSREIKIPSPEDESKGEANIPSPHGKKRAISEDLGEKAHERGKMPLSGLLGLGGRCHRAVPWQGQAFSQIVSEQGCFKHVPFVSCD